MEQKKGFKRNQFAGLLAALFCIVAFNSILIIKDKKENNNLYAAIDFTSPFNFLEQNSNKANYIIAPTDKKASTKPALVSAQKAQGKILPVTKQSNNVLSVSLLANNMFVNVAQDDVDASLTKEQKEKVKTTVAITKKVLGNLQWKEVENVIADVLTEKEKVIAKQQYMNELNKAGYWKNIEQNMKAQYQNMDWQNIDNKMQNALTAIQLDSLQTTYTVILNQLNKVTTDAKAKVNVCPFPDQSMEQIEKAKEELSNKVNTIKALRSDKKVVRL